MLLPPDPAWNGRYPYAGFLFLDDGTPLDPSLEAWLAVGDPPVCIGFGSMAGESPERVGKMLFDAVRGSGRRCLVLTGSAKLFGETGGAAIVPDGFFVTKSAPHGALFPRCAVVVHHGGSGTTAAAARAGVPQVVLPMMLDQCSTTRSTARVPAWPRSRRA